MRGIFILMNRTNACCIYSSNSYCCVYSEICGQNDYVEIGYLLFQATSTSRKQDRRYRLYVLFI
ncbi:hypothetical protein GCM10007140_21280 [Priestia taiwanensis]|uniref:Uncharacterized protein n=2 Tax=Priestia taiwanensis TaxID=1347902 RepID=A0A917ASE8_9BACI|nr:hypothetical protein GCM10007140_21280 [Priestia taiwanensis]